MSKSLWLIWKYLTKNLETWSQAPLYPYLFTGKKVSPICYIDDQIFWFSEKDVVDLVIQLHADDVDIEEEDVASRLLWFHIECNQNTKFLNMTQKGLIEKVL